jgi:hypothetical protein
MLNLEIRLAIKHRSDLFHFLPKSLPNLCQNALTAVHKCDTDRRPKLRGEKEMPRFCCVS